MSGAIHQWTARQTRQAIRGRETSATEVAQALLARIARLDGRDAPGGGLGAFLHVDPARVLARAAALDAEHATAADRPLFGVPVAVKDNLCTRDVPTTAASRILERFVPPYTRPPSSAWKRPARSSSARPTATSSRWARRPRTRRSA